ncbi:pectin acetylesterase, family CE13 [Zostera marina]|uniref:Pectin acetylesterase n=1 Tax=Zostera marina TaxID=29655 RepID=A0A0K9NLC5_ZOSMR|nr:pectin acetylesterase, family CE13 [Zostera marina]
MDRMRICVVVFLGICLLSVQVESYDVNITYLESAVITGAVCLDGSPPAYHFSAGFDRGVDNWLVFLEGGGWCDTPNSCLYRKNTRLGSSKYMETNISFSGILNNNPNSNPDFFDWNKVKIRYCDGSSFTGDMEEVDPKTKLHYRGGRIFEAVIDALKEIGMNHAENVLLSGCSAGGLAAILQCDHFRNIMPGRTNVKCLADAGYFINAKSIDGTKYMQNYYRQVVRTHQSAKNLPSSCTSKMNPGLCFFPENVVSEIQTPLFLLNAAYDSWQIKNILAPGVADPHGIWDNCKADITRCSSDQLRIMQGFRSEFLKAVEKIGHASSKGMFINSCYAHCQSGIQETWLAEGSPVVANSSISKAVGDWYTDRDRVRIIDCPYPCDSTCHNDISHIPDQDFLLVNVINNWVFKSRS